METPARNFSLPTALSDSFGYLLAGPSDFFALVWKYLLISSLVGAAISAVGYLSPANEVLFYTFGGAGVVAILLLSLGYYIVATRHCVLAEPRPAFLPTFPTVFVRFLLYTLATLAILAVALLFPVSVALAIASQLNYDEATLDALAGGAILISILIAVAFVFYVTGRIGSWFVSASIGKALTLKDAWQTTRGAGIRILVGLALIGIVFGALDMAVEAIPPAYLRSTEDMYELMLQGRAPVATALAMIAKIALYLTEVAIFAAYAGSVYRQTAQ